MNHYTGIGSRETPSEILKLFENVGKFLASKGFILRSGHAPGSDISFENGVDKVNGKKEIYLPWRNFEGSDSEFIVSDIRAFKLTELYHPYWSNLKQSSRKLQARNSHQVLGWDLNTPSKFIICWTKNGKEVGGTAQALRIANEYDIPIFNCGVFNDINILKLELKEFLINNTDLEESDFK